MVEMRPANTSPVVPSSEIQSPSCSVVPPADMRCAVDVDIDILGARDARLAHLPRDDRSVAGRAAARGQDADGWRHAVEVFRRRLASDEDDRLAVARPARPSDPGRRRPCRRPRQARPPGRGRSGRQPCARDSGSNCGTRICCTCIGWMRLSASVARDQPFVDHLDGGHDGGFAGALGVARLQHVQLAALDGELQVLDVFVGLLQTIRDLLELAIDLGPDLAHLRDADRRPNAGDHVLALRVGQELAEDLALASRRVAREGDAGARVVAHVAEDHGHHADRRAQVVRDLELVAVVDGALCPSTS